MPFFEEPDLDAMFAAFDVNDRGFITPQQYEQGTNTYCYSRQHQDSTSYCWFRMCVALISLSIERPSLRLPESITQINQSLFTRSMYVGGDSEWTECSRTLMDS